ncbi:MAG TPA: cytochrome c peroxidase [Thermoguttaceae bacterium]|nr:cytochrome c peroxidase [Thermoguttaceae bacterium]
MYCVKWFGGRGRSGVAALTILVAMALIAGDVPKDVPRDEHGAALVKHQEQVLDQLLPKEPADGVPAGVDPVTWASLVPTDNAMTPERIALGRKLYFDTRLSADGTVSCATCHDTTRALTDQRATSEGIRKQLGKRNAPTTANAALLHVLFLDGRSPTLEHQAKAPIINPVEMGMADGDAAVAAIKDDAEYQKMFRAAYGRDVNYEDVGRAIAAFERTLVFLDSPFRRFLAGDENAISADAKAGWELFNGKARCVSCHPMSPSNPLGTDNRFHNVGVSARHQDFEKLAREALKAMADDPSEQRLDELAVGTDMSELGRFMVTHNRSEIGVFRTLQILNAGITPPYMHDGSMETLWDVMDHYNKGGEPNPFLDGGMEPLALTEDEINQVVAFLFTLTDDRFADENQRQFAEQKAKAAQKRPFRDDDMATRRTLGFEDRIKAEANADTQKGAK